MVEGVGWEESDPSDSSVQQCQKKKKKADMSGGVFFGFCFSYVKCYGLNLY